MTQSQNNYPAEGFSSNQIYFIIFALIALLIIALFSGVITLPFQLNFWNFLIIFISILTILFFFTALYFGIIGYFRKKNREKRAVNSVLFSIAAPKNNELYADATETMFTSLYSIYQEKGTFLTGQEQISFEIVAQKNEITLHVYASEDIASIVKKQIYAQYPCADIIQSPGYNIFFKDSKINFAEIYKSQSTYLPIKTYRDLAKEEGTKQLKEISVDSMSALTNAMTKLDKNEGAAVQILVRPTSQKWIRKGKKEIDKIFSKTKNKDDGKPGEKLSHAEDKKIREISDTISKAGFETLIRIVTVTPKQHQADIHQRNILAAFSQFNREDANKLTYKTFSSPKKVFRNFIYRYFPLFTSWSLNLPFLGRTSIFNSAELATLFHLPNKKIDTPYLTWVKAKKAPAPSNVPEIPGKGGVILGKNSYRGLERNIAIKKDDRRRHIYSIGKTGMGKTCLAQNLIFQDIKNGEGCCYIDPHGDAIEAILKIIPEERIDDVILFDPGDLEHPMGLNMLEYDNEDQKDFAVQEVITILYKLFGKQGFIGPRFEHIVRNSLLTIMKHPEGGSLVEMMRIITDDTYKDECLEYVTNPLVKAFWYEEMSQQVQFHKSEMLGPVLSKFGRFVSNDMIRNIIGQTKSSIDFPDIMNNKKILLVNLAKGKVGDINCNLLGMIFVSKILMAALSRVKIPEQERKDFYLYVDEFQNFATDTFATILSEARKYRLNLYITHQYIGQLKDEIKNAVFGNVGTMMFMRIGAPDAEQATKELKPVFDEEDVINVDKFTLYTKLLVDGVASKPFSLHTFPPYTTPNDYSEVIKENSRLKYSRPREKVEEEIYRRGRFKKLDLL